jgi:hypothetical protein
MDISLIISSQCTISLPLFLPFEYLQREWENVQQRIESLQDLQREWENLLCNIGHTYCPHKLRGKMLYIAKVNITKASRLTIFHWHLHFLCVFFSFLCLLVLSNKQRFLCPVFFHWYLLFFITQPSCQLPTSSLTFSVVCFNTCPFLELTLKCLRGY